MADTDTAELQALLRDEIHAETSKIAWSELQRFFAAGRAVHVSAELDLVEVALQVSNDNSALIRQWIDEGSIAPVPDDRARRWIEADATVWAVVVKPWVLVQDIKESRSEH